MKKKVLLTFILSIFSVLILGSFSVSAATYGDLTYSISNGEVSISYCNNKNVTSVKIPQTIDGYPVTTICEDAFNACKSLKSVTLGSNIKKLEHRAFYACSSLSSIDIPNNVTYIGNSAFYNCFNLKSVSIGSSVTSIDNYAFYNCQSLSSLNLGKKVKSIGTSAFYGCESLVNVTIPDSVTNISDSIFSGCINLKNATIGKGLTRIGDSTFSGCINLTNIIIPENITTIGGNAFFRCRAFTDIIIPESVTYVGNSAFSDCSGLVSITITNKLKDIGNYAFNNCNALTTVNYFGSPDEYKSLKVGEYYNNNFTNIEPKYFICITYMDDNGYVLKNDTVEYGKVINPTLTPSKSSTIKYKYVFTGWDGFTTGMTACKNVTFIATYTAVLNKYTYKFLDESGTTIKEMTVDYGTSIVAPKINDKTEYYVFDYWKDYNEGMVVTGNVTFKAVFKYKNYLVNVEGISEPISVTYNSNFTIKPQKIDDYHYFIGYFTEENGKGTQITNEKGESLSVYNIVGDLKVYPYFYEGYINKVELQCVKTAMPGDTIIQSAIFATDKNATYFIATIKYPKYLNFKSIKGIDFKEATQDPEEVVGDYKYLDITCVFDYEGNFAEINTNYIPFEIEFNISTDTPDEDYEISIENVMLIGDDTFDITDVKNHTLTIIPKLAEKIIIEGTAEIDAVTKFNAVVSPDYTKDKTVVWSINDESVATITQDGTVTPVKNGTVIITATAKDGSEVFATKSVDVIAYAKINSLDFGSGVVLTEFNPDVRKYTVYVKENATSISLTPTFSGGGVLRPNGSGVWVSGRSKDFELNTVETTITLNRENVTDMTNSVYTIEVIMFEGTKTEVSEDKKSFTITPINIENVKTVILALYNGEQFVEMQSAVYTGEAVPFTTTKAYTKAKVMVWDDITNLKPVCDFEFVK